MGESGHAFTAPVWVSEFGASVRSDYWLKMMRYLSARDIDWAYWPLNPFKQVNKELHGLTWVDVNTTWANDTWGFLSPDWISVRQPWQLEDLRNIMQAPASWVP